MSNNKKIDWESIYTNPIPKKNQSGQDVVPHKERMRKAFEEAEEIQKAQRNLQALMPALDQLLLIRMKNHTPIKVVRPLVYRAQEFYKSEYGDVIYSSRNEAFGDTQKVINPGTELIFKSLNKSLMSFLFEDSKSGEEYEIYWADKQQLLLNTDVYSVVYNMFGKE